jgi:hypothetical protein
VQSAERTLVRAVLTILVGGLVAAGATGCDKDAADATSTTSPPPSAAAAAAPSAAPAAGNSAAATSFARPRSPISGVRADALADDWSAHWHVKLEVVQNDLVHARQTTVHYPLGHGRLELGVQQEGTGTDPAPSFVHCVLRDASLGEKFVTLTRALLDRLLADCWGAVLIKGEARQIGDWAMTAAKKNGVGNITSEHAFARFTVRLQRAPTVVALAMFAK